jgi:6-pyruvoyltetrahydropterin/6-carboxytetrahydropterin synthase
LAKIKLKLLARGGGRRHKRLMIEQSRRFYVSVAHRYWNVGWSEERNREVYGRMASQEGVGSNLALEIRVKNLTEDLDLAPYESGLKSVCDHRCFFTDFAEFHERASTLEAIALFLGAKLFAQKAPNGEWSAFRVDENRRLGCTVYPDREAVDLHVRAFNLTCTLRRRLDEISALASSRSEIEEAVRGIANEFAQARRGESETQWGERLFSVVSAKVKDLEELQVDYGHQQSLCVRA